MQNAIAGCIVSTRILMPPHDKMSIKHDMGELFLKHMENKTINGSDDDATTCAFSRECCEVN
jgi:hypothetical protein